MAKQRVKVVHKWAQDAKGNSKPESARPIVQTVEAVYLGGKLRTSSGDVWDVEVNSNRNEADFVTVVPRHKAA